MITDAVDPLVERLVLTMLTSSQHWPALGVADLEVLSKLGPADSRQLAAELIVDMGRRLAAELRK
jgi:hypothetical protein